MPRQADLRTLIAKTSMSWTPAGVERRLASGLLDTALLGAGLALILTTELVLASLEEAYWAVYGWFIVFAPLYFALYHAFDTGSTPGQLELRVGLRDARTGRPPGLGRAVARAYVGFLFLVSVLPALVDLLVLVASGRSLRDRVTSTTVVRVALEGEAQELAQPTVPELAAIFEPPAETRRYLRRGWRLLAARARLVVGVAAVLYAVLVALAVVVGFLTVVDSPDPVLIVGLYAPMTALLLGSSVYWTQASVVIAVEEVRVGSPSASVSQTLVRASRRANALTAALLLLVPIALAAIYMPFLYVTLLVAGRLALVAPALVLEDRRVLGAFRRSWQLTRGRTWRTLGFFLASGAMLLGAFVVEALLVSAVVASSETWAGTALSSLLLVSVLAVPFVLLLAWLGSAWSLLYEDARRALPPEGER